MRTGGIRAGLSWPASLPPIDRLAAVPAFREDAARDVPDRRVILSFEAPGGDPVPICWRGRDGAIVWSFDPADWIRCILSETYVSRWRRPITSRLPWVNYSRLPHAVKGLMHGVLGSGAAPGGVPVAFPELPLDDLVERIRALCLCLAAGSRSGEGGPAGAPAVLPGLWPEGRRAALTLTHDVDTAWILENRNRAVLREILDLETSLAFRGAWYVTADRVRSAGHRRALELVVESGHEVGIHGWNHDSKLSYLSPRRQEARISKARRRLAGFPVAGIRTPWYVRSPQLFRVLSESFAYDTSVPNASAIFSSTTHSGCCTVFPYRPFGRLYELPMTLPPDTFDDLAAGYRLLGRVADEVIARRGVVVVTLHPQPHQSANRKGLRHYYDFLRRLSKCHGERLWSAPPVEIIERYCCSIRAAFPRNE